MIRTTLLCFLFFVAVTSEALAAAATPCASLGTRLTAAEISSAFENQLICAQKMGALTGNDRWAEEHRSGGELWEQGKGTTSKIHPPTKVGTWKSVELTKGKGKGEVKSPSEDLVQYDYSGGSSYSWSVFYNSGTKTYTFCNSTETKVIATASIKSPNPSSTNACGF